MRRTSNLRTEPTADVPLKRALGLPSATALVVGNMIGSGIFLLPASLAAVALATGSGSLLGASPRRPR